MRYMLLIFGPEDASPAQGTPEFDEMMAGYSEFTRDIYAAGAMDRGDELDSSVTATTVRVRNGTAMLTDGPFIESKEQLGGYYIVDVPNLDEAIRWAARIPGASTGAVEVRPIIDHE
ncbi:YciI family protein [soil metagenome]